MARVHIRYFGILRELAGKREESIAIEDSASTAELVERITELHGKKFSEYVFESKGRLKEGFAYAINGDSVPERSLPTIKCKEVTEFVILPPISGGTQI
ncbi:MAG: MoaD/ThiS family protein [Thaumarchaeota archaeon]|nr:MoaD/ThiS family protein [Nitrososphaerota archaeon]